MSRWRVRVAAIAGSIVLGSTVLTAVACGRSPSEPLSDRAFVVSAWAAYKRTYIDADGYVRDPSRGTGEVISEAQGYALLRAVWMRDEETFFRVWRWTDRHLRRADGLYSWRWTPAAGGHVLDANSASDADQEIALALLLASRVFERAALGTRARDLLRAIRDHESIAVGAGWFPAAGNWAVAGRVVNLSYFLPYAYPYFAREDPEGRWEQAIDTGYALLDKTRRLPGARLIPDFITTAADGSVVLPEGHHGLSSDFSSDAMRIYWRVAVDCELHGHRRACEDPLGAETLVDLLNRDEALYTRYRLDGTPIERTESLSFYAIAWYFLARHNPEAARMVRTRKLTEDVLESILKSERRYYDANWMWFSIAAKQRFISERTWAAMQGQMAKGKGQK